METMIQTEWAKEESIRMVFKFSWFRLERIANKLAHNIRSNKRTKSEEDRIQKEGNF